MFSRPGCGLCAEAAEVIASVARSRGFIYEEVSIEGDDALELEYGMRIPVVLVDGSEIAEYRVNAAQLNNALDRRLRA
jgi:glutaredoxin